MLTRSRMLWRVVMPTLWMHADSDMPKCNISGTSVTQYTGDFVTRFGYSIPSVTHSAPPVNASASCAPAVANTDSGSATCGRNEVLCHHCNLACGYHLCKQCAIDAWLFDISSITHCPGMGSSAASEEVPIDFGATPSPSNGSDGDYGAASCGSHCDVGSDGSSQIAFDCFMDPGCKCGRQGHSSFAQEHDPIY